MAFAVGVAFEVVLEVLGKVPYGSQLWDLKHYCRILPCPTLQWIGTHTTRADSVAGRVLGWDFEAGQLGEHPTRCPFAQLQKAIGTCCNFTNQLLVHPSEFTHASSGEVSTNHTDLIFCAICAPFSGGPGM